MVNPTVLDWFVALHLGPFGQCKPVTRLIFTEWLPNVTSRLDSVNLRMTGLFLTSLLSYLTVQLTV